MGGNIVFRPEAFFYFFLLSQLLLHLKYKTVNYFYLLDWGSCLFKELLDMNYFVLHLISEFSINHEEAVMGVISFYFIQVNIFCWCLSQMEWKYLSIGPLTYFFSTLVGGDLSLPNKGLRSQEVVLWFKFPEGSTFLLVSLYTEWKAWGGIFLNLFISCIVSYF